MTTCACDIVGHWTTCRVLAHVENATRWIMRRFGNSPALSIMRHNDPTDFIASCIKEVHCDVEVEPKLQPLTCEVLQRLILSLSLSISLSDLSLSVFGGQKHLWR